MRLAAEIQRGQRGQWFFGIGPDSPCLNPDDGRMYSLYQHRDGTAVEYRSTREDLPGVGHGIITRDFGILLRGPHPRHPERIGMVLAGLTAKGTGAACLAATKPDWIDAFQKHLHASTRDRTISDKSSAFWVLVEGTSDARGLLDEGNVGIVDSGWYDFPSGSSATPR